MCTVHHEIKDEIHELGVLQQCYNKHNYKCVYSQTAKTGRETWSCETKQHARRESGPENIIIPRVFFKLGGASEQRAAP